MSYRGEQQLVALLAKQGPKAALAQISGLLVESKVVDETVAVYNAMQRNRLF